MLNHTLQSFVANSLPPPKILIPWLNHGLSLTDKLKHEVGDASLDVINQQWKKTTWWDKYTLGVMTKLVIHREIIMSAHQIACWYARTIIPEYCYREHLSFFNRLSQESLGTMIFNSPTVKRQCMFYYSVNTSSLEFHWLPALYREQDVNLWARFSIFSLSEHYQFYLVEILLPGLLRIIN